MQERNVRIGSAEHVGECWRDMAGGASSGAGEQVLTAARSGLVEASGRRRRRRQGELILHKSRQLGGHEVRPLRDADPNPEIAETAVSTHLRDTHVVVPIGDDPVAGIRLESDTL